LLSAVEQLTITWRFHSLHLDYCLASVCTLAGCTMSARSIKSAYLLVWQHSQVSTTPLLLSCTFDQHTKWTSFYLSWWHLFWITIMYIGWKSWMAKLLKSVDSTVVCDNDDNKLERIYNAHDSSITSESNYLHSICIQANNSSNYSYLTE